MAVLNGRSARRCFAAAPDGAIPRPTPSCVQAAADIFGEVCRATPLACGEPVTGFRNRREVSAASVCSGLPAVLHAAACAAVCAALCHLFPEPPARHMPACIRCTAASIITAIAGFNSANVNMTRLPTMVQYAPSGEEAPPAAPLQLLCHVSWQPLHRSIWLAHSGRPGCLHPCSGGPPFAAEQAAVLLCKASVQSDRQRAHRLTHAPTYAAAGTSVKNIVHWAQAIRKSRQQEQPLFQVRRPQLLVPLRCCALALLTGMPDCVLNPRRGVNRVWKVPLARPLCHPPPTDV